MNPKQFSEAFNYFYKQVEITTQKYKGINIEYDPKDPDNKRQLIEKNLKLVMSVVKNYDDGINTDEILSAGLEGICVAYEKYNPKKNKIVYKMEKQINEGLYYDEAAILLDYYIYSPDLIIDKYKQQFGTEAKVPKADILQFVRENTQTAKFTSFAYFYIKGYIINHLKKISNIADLPIDMIDCNTYLNYDELFVDKFDKESSTEKEKSYLKLYEGISERDLNIYFERNGVKGELPAKIKVLTEKYNLKFAEIKKVVKAVEYKIHENIDKYNIDIDDLL